MNAGTAPMRPVSGIRIARSASDGIVCTMTVAPRMMPSSAGRVAASIPSGKLMALIAARDTQGEVGAKSFAPEDAAGRRARLDRRGAEAGEPMLVDEACGNGGEIL